MGASAADMGAEVMQGKWPSKRGVGGRRIMALDRALGPAKAAFKK